MGSEIQAVLLPLVSWINQLLFGIAQGLMNAAANLLSSGLKHLIFFESPYYDPRMNAAFQYNLDIFPQLLAIAVLLGVASRPFADRLETDSLMLFWKFVKVIIFVAVGRQIMHFGLLLVNAVGKYLYPSSYSMHFTGETLQQSLSAAGATGAGLAMTAIILSGLSVLSALLIIAIFLIREFLFTATFVLLPILGCMLYLDFGPFSDAADIAKLLLRSTAYLLLAGVIMAGLLQVGAAYGGAFLDNGDGGTQTADQQQSMGDLIEAYFFWLVGLLAPAFIGIKAAMAAGVSSRQIIGAGNTSGKSYERSAGSSDSQRTALVDQARYGTAEIDTRLNNVGSETIASIKGKTKHFSSHVERSRFGIPNQIKPLTHVGKNTTRRAAKDIYRGTKYGATNLGESPVDWARAGIDHYRKEPLVTSPEGAEDTQTSSETQEQTSSSDTGEDSPTSSRLRSRSDDWEQGYM